MKKVIATLLTITMFSFPYGKKFKCYASENKNHKTAYFNTIEPGNDFYIITTTLNNNDYQYIVTNDGIISFSFEENDLISNDYDLLVEAMLDVTKSLNPEFLTGRTKEGIKTELVLHYLSYKLKYDVKRSKEADMGSLSGLGYDYNSADFEKIAEDPKHLYRVLKKELLKTDWHKTLNVLY